jgi:predicted small lipoprotein YifL
MNPLRSALVVLLAGAVSVCGLAGCGLKGSLSMPEKSGNVVIRGKDKSGTQTGQSAPAEPEKLPPPELPRSGSGSPR